MDIADTEACYRAVKSRDRRFDGVFYTGVRTTGIYCRPSCPAVTPQQRNVTFFRTAAAAQAAGFRACKRCLPDATPGSPDWDVAADATGRAMRLIADGVVERDGVAGLARRVGYTARHLTRLLNRELGAGPLALARARRAQTARVLIETTPMSFADVAFASGFASVRQFNDTVRSVYAASPTQLRGRDRVRGTRPDIDEPGAPAGVLDLRLAVRRPFAARDLLDFLAVRAVPGVEATGADWYARTLRLPYGHGHVRLTFDTGPTVDVSSSRAGRAPAAQRDGGTGFVRCELRVEDLRDAAVAVERCRRLLDADADPIAVDDELGADRRLAPLVRARPGLRVPGQVDGAELAVRAVLGQQVSVEHARRLTGLLVDRYGEPHRFTDDRLFPEAAVLAAADLGDLPMPRSRSRTIAVLCQALASGDVVLDRGMERAEVRRSLLALPGIGEWTAGYVAMRALGDPDVLLPTDVGVRRALRSRGCEAGDVLRLGERWRPWRSYAQMHLWASLADDAGVRAPRSTKTTPRRAAAAAGTTKES